MVTRIWTQTGVVTGGTHCGELGASQNQYGKGWLSCDGWRLVSSQIKILIGPVGVQNGGNDGR
jgi:hypothetical protein